jgi:triosephosphate isomerase
MRKNIVAGNWKMNKNVIDAQQLMAQLLEYKKENATNCEVWIAPPSLYLMMARDIFENNEIGVFSQDMSEFESGAYTGEISADMLQSIEADGSIIGHSERRQYHGETDSHCNRKVKLALDKGLIPVYCNGETLEQRKSGQHFEVVKTKLKKLFSRFLLKKLKKWLSLTNQFGQSELAKLPLQNKRKKFTRTSEVLSLQNTDKKLPTKFLFFTAVL